MIPDRANGSRARHDFVYDDEHGRHVTLRYDVERTPGLKLHHLDSRESMIEHVTATNALQASCCSISTLASIALAHPLLHSDLHQNGDQRRTSLRWTNRARGKPILSGTTKTPAHKHAR